MSRIVRNAVFTSSIITSVATSPALALGPARPVFSGSAQIDIDVSRAAAQVDERYLSYAIDTAQLVGGKWWDDGPSIEGGRGSALTAPFDFSIPRLRALARGLAPAYLRIGGSEADFAYYDLSPKGDAPLPHGDESVLRPERLEAASEFVRAVGAEIFFDLNAGPAARDGRGDWDPASAEGLVRYARDRALPIKAWELGNEVNAFWVIHGLGSQISARQYARDYGIARGMLGAIDPGARLAGPASAYWPILGEPLSGLFGIMSGFFRESRGPVDIVSWHFYPTESSRCPIGLRRASASELLKPETLNEVRVWAESIREERDRRHPEARLWMSESGSAQCGGQPGVSDRFAPSFWWLDELGALARLGHEVVARQTLTGSDYGLLRPKSLDPTPDYWASVLWKKLMGTRVLGLPGFLGEGTLRAYAHCAARSAGAPKGAVTALLMNLSPTQPERVRLAPVGNGPRVEYAVTAEGPLAAEVALNGELLRASAEGELPALEGAQREPGELTVAPLSYVFAVFPEAGAAACLE